MNFQSSALWIIAVRYIWERVKRFLWKWELKCSTKSIGGSRTRGFLLEITGESTIFGQDFPSYGLHEQRDFQNVCTQIPFEAEGQIWESKNCSRNFWKILQNCSFQRARRAWRVFPTFRWFNWAKGKRASRAGYESWTRRRKMESGAPSRRIRRSPAGGNPIPKVFELWHFRGKCEIAIARKWAREKQNCWWKGASNRCLRFRTEVRTPPKHSGKLWSHFAPFSEKVNHRLSNMSYSADSKCVGKYGLWRTQPWIKRRNTTHWSRSGEFWNYQISR